MDNDIQTNINANYINEENSLLEEFVELIKQKFQKEKILVIDRFEGNLAVCEDRETKEMINIEISNLPNNIKEGDIIKFKDNKYELHEELRNEIEDRINEKMKNLFNN